MYQKGEEVKPKPYRRHRFQQRYTRADIDLMAGIDEAHQTLSGPATQKLLQRSVLRLPTKSSISDWRNCRWRNCTVWRSRRYREQRIAYQPTRPTTVPIGERRRPEPDGQAGYLRVDTVHQGDLDGVKGVYHINAVDEVTQWQVVGRRRKSARHTCCRCWARKLEPGESAHRESATDTSERYAGHLRVGLAPNTGVDHATGIRVSGAETVRASRSLRDLRFVPCLVLFLHSQFAK